MDEYRKFLEGLFAVIRQHRTRKGIRAIRVKNSHWKFL
jgi:hypothetical protein